MTNLRILRMGTFTLTQEQAVGLIDGARDFQKRGNPNQVDSWDFIDMLTILARTVETELDAGWIALIGDDFAGFAILCFGPSLHQGDMDGQIVALYLKPGTPLDVAPQIVRHMREHAAKVGAQRIICGTQRDVTRAFRRLGASPIGVVYELPIHEKETQPRQSSYLS